MGKWKYCFISAACLSVSVLASGAAQADSMLEGAQACTRYMPKAERYHNIPTHWLAAIASQESGRYNERLGLTLPWPWTLNVNGKGYYFDTRQEALAQIRKLQAKGIDNFDVGCMQVNMRYHGHAFSDPAQALDPRYNVAYAARFLRENFDELRSWKKATAAYHSRTPDKGSKYFGTVFRRWEKVIAKLGASADTASLMVERPTALASNAYDANAGRKRYTGYQVNADKAQYEPMRMKTIKVSETLSSPTNRVRDEHRSGYVRSMENGVMVIRSGEGAVAKPSAGHEAQRVLVPSVPVSTSALEVPGAAENLF